MFKAAKWERVGAYLRLITAYTAFNARAAYAFRTNFWFSVFSMLMSDTVWVAYWLLFFARFPHLNGWQSRDLLLLWGISALSFGVVTVIFGNLLNVQQVVQEGELDIYLTNPKPVLLHLLISRQSVNGYGDILFGIIVLPFVMPHTLMGVSALVMGTLASGLLFFGFVLVTQTLGFLTGSAQGVGAQLVNAFLSFQTYPPSIFRGWLSKVIVYFIIPSGVIALMPWPVLAGKLMWLPYVAVGAGACLTWIGRRLFDHGLRIYTSGNRLTVRS